MGLDTVDLVLQVEEAFTIRLPNDEAGQIATVQDLCQAICRAAAAEGQSLDPCTVQDRVHFLLTTQFGVPPGHLGPQVRLVQDLGLD